MDANRLLSSLSTDQARLREVAARDLDAAVPSCPGWTVADLVRHVAQVYLHKAETIRLGGFPEVWPPPELAGAAPLTALDSTYSTLSTVLTSRSPDEPAVTWFAPEQTIGFWIRRMAQETVIHRIDAELALGGPVTDVPADIAVDGIDELLVRFLDYGTKRWAAEIGPALDAVAPYRIEVRTGDRAWLVSTGPKSIDVTIAEAVDSAGDADAVVSAEPDRLLRWLWGRGPDDLVMVTGEPRAVAELCTVRAFVT